MHGYGVVPSRHDYRGYSGAFILGPFEWYGTAEVAFLKYDNLIKEYRRARRKVPASWLQKRARARAAFNMETKRSQRREADAAKAEQAAADALAAAGLTNPMVDTPIPGMPSGVPDPTILDPSTGISMGTDAGVSGGEPEGPDYTKWAIAGAVALAAALGLAYATMSKK
jgi:hypothetical protein